MLDSCDPSRAIGGVITFVARSWVRKRSPAGTVISDPVVDVLLGGRVLCVSFLVLGASVRFINVHVDPGSSIAAQSSFIDSISIFRLASCFWYLLYCW